MRLPIHFILKLIILKKQKMVMWLRLVRQEREREDELGERATFWTVEGWAGHGEEWEFILTQCGSTNGF